MVAPRAGSRRQIKQLRDRGHDRGGRPARTPSGVSSSAGPSRWAGITVSWSGRKAAAPPSVVETVRPEADDVPELASLGLRSAGTRHRRRRRQRRLDIVDSHKRRLTTAARPQSRSDCLGQRGERFRGTALAASRSHFLQERSSGQTARRRCLRRPSATPRRRGANRRRSNQGRSGWRRSAQFCFHEPPAASGPAMASRPAPAPGLRAAEAAANDWVLRWRRTRSLAREQAAAGGVPLGKSHGRSGAATRRLRLARRRRLSRVLLSWRSASRPRPSQASGAIVSCGPVLADRRARS